MTNTKPLRIAVLAAMGRNPVSGVARPNRDDLLALEIARGLGGEVVIVHAGDEDEAQATEYLAYAATGLELLPLATGQDVAAALAGHLQGFDLILTGSRAEGGEGSGLVPYLVAEQLGLPIVAHALGVFLKHSHAEVTQALGKGQRRNVRVRLPAVIAIHPMAPVKPRYAYARRVAGNVARLQPAITPVEPNIWRTERAGKRPVKFRATETKAGHARMQSAIATETKGGTVVTLGTPADKAQAILGYLRTHKLIDW